MAYVGWEHKVISSDKGKRLVHYYLRDASGKKVLAVVGKEQSVRHMSYVVAGDFLTAAASPSLSPSSALDFGRHRRIKWKSKREVVDWLSSLVSDCYPQAYPSMIDRFSEDEDAEPTTIPIPKGLSAGNMGHLSKEFSWLGACSWNSKKKRKHYRSFCRNGITISVHDFIYVMSEEHKRLVAYVEDLYEDSKANKMVVVRWFHKVDEVGFVLPPDVNDREIFFSLCLQDFSVECIDGVAAVLSAQDFDKFQNEVKHRGKSSWDPYVCRRQIDADDVKPFDITQVQGYWSQELLRSMYATPGTSLKLRLKITHGSSRSIPKEASRSGGVDIDVPGVIRDVNRPKSSSFATGSRGERHGRPPTAPPLLRKELLKQKLLRQQKHLVPGSCVEVLSQDSGIRGCWFRCVVLKSRHDKVKVRYMDVLDADDAGNLEEWVLASRVAPPDQLGIRLCGRPVVRPDLSNSDNKLSCKLDVGSIVDAWWHDGWWEGIVIRGESEGKICVYFPGEHQVCTFGLGDLRPSQDWVGNKWNLIEPRPSIASSLPSDIYEKNHRASVSTKEVEAEPLRENPTGFDQSVANHRETNVPNLAQVCHLDSLNWSSSRKRRRAREISKGGGSRCKRQCSSGGGITTSSSSGEDVEQDSNKDCNNFLLPTTLAVVVDHDKCKIGGGDPMLVSPMALCSSLVLSQ